MRVPRHQRGFTLIELLMVVAIIGIIAAVAIPGLLRARMSGNEAAAIGSARAVNAAEIAYSASTGGGGFAIRFAVLSAPCPGSTQGFISKSLATDPTIKSGYTVTLAVGKARANVTTDCNAKRSRASYYLTAVPTTFGTTGGRSFATSSLAGTIYFTSAVTPPPEAGGVAIQ